jgi:hypothetical protein
MTSLRSKGNALRRVVRGLVYAAWLLLGCSSLADDEEACADYADAVCRTLHNCSVGEFDARWGDDGACRDGETRACKRRLTARGTHETADTISTCAKALAPRSCRDNWPTACLLPPGDLLGGDACFLSSQCQTGWCKREGGPDVCGTCAVFLTGCSTDRDCASPLKCVSGKCEFPPLVEEGQTCGEMTPPCRYGLECAMPAGNFGTCRATGVQGGPCSPGSPGSCDPIQRFACDLRTATCQPFTPRPAPGEPCFRVANDPNLLGYCNGNASCSDGTKCKQLAREGEPCADVGCLPPSLCVQKRLGTGTYRLECALVDPNTQCKIVR